MEGLNEQIQNESIKTLATYIEYLKDPSTKLEQKLSLLIQFSDEKIVKLSTIRKHLDFKVSIDKIRLHKSGSKQKAIETYIDHATRWLNTNSKKISALITFEDFEELTSIQEAEAVTEKLAEETNKNVIELLEINHASTIINGQTSKEAYVGPGHIQKLQDLSAIIIHLNSLNPILATNLINQLIESDNDLQYVLNLYEISFDSNKSHSDFNHKIQSILLTLDTSNASEKNYDQSPKNSVNKSKSSRDRLRDYISENFSIPEKLIRIVFEIYEVYKANKEKDEFIKKMSEFPKSKTIRIRNHFGKSNLRNTYDFLYSIFQEI